MKLLLCAAFVYFVNSFSYEPFDFVEDAILKYVNRSSDPCDDFYRHACPLGSPGDLTSEAFFGIISELRKEQFHSYWNQLHILNDFMHFSFSDAPDQLESTISFYRNLFIAACEEGPKTKKDFTGAFYVISETISEFPKNELSFLENDDPCSETADLLAMNIPKIHTSRNSSIKWNMEYFLAIVENLRQEVEAIDTILIADVREGIRETVEMKNKMAVHAERWLKETPWAVNNNAVEIIHNVTSQLFVYDNYGVKTHEIANSLMPTEAIYLECSGKLGQLENGKLFCLLLASVTRNFDYRVNMFHSIDNAFNKEPVIFFGFPNYYHNSHGKTMAAKLGYTGFTVGHEMGHSFIQDFTNLTSFPYFSRDATNCIQNQYNKTCYEFEENNCETTELMLDDNGADIIGLQLAYELLSDYYTTDLSSTIDRLGVTNEQLFFYSMAFQFCSGLLQGQRSLFDDHASRNVRVNVVAQHPGFQKAFNCPDDSRMMRSATKQCVIYGKDAPETRRKFQNI